MAWRQNAGGGYGGGGWQQGGWKPQARPTGGASAGAAPRPTGITAPGAYAQKPRPQVIPAAVAAAGGAAAGKETYVVYSTAKEGEEVVVRTLIGEYVENAANHGRKVYKKTLTEGAENVDVFMYYWDSRDGPAFEGWWFGNKLGGTQVWSHCNDAGTSPPSSGWKIPWDGQVRPSLVVELKKAGAGAAGAGAAGAGVDASIVAAGQEAKAALEESKSLHEGYSSLEGIKNAETLLQPHLQYLSEAMKRLMESQKGTSGDVAKKMAQTGTMVRTTQGLVNTELAKLRGAKAKAELTQKQRANDEKDAATLAEVMPEAEQKTNAAEDAVEKAVITAEMIEAGGEDLDEVRQAVAQTEQAAQEAQKAIGEARIYLNAKQASCRRLESEAVKQQAATDLGKLQTQLQQAQSKLNPLKTVRQDFVQRTAAQKLIAETLERLSPAEVDVDRAEEATMMMSTGEAVSKEMMQQAEQAVSKASEHVTAVLKFIASKKATVQGLPRDELAKLEERAKGSQQRLAEMKSQHKENAEKVQCESLLQEAAEKLQSVEETVAKAADAEGPFLMGVEELPLDDALGAIKACETSSTSANTAVSIARMFIATKLVEAKRFTAGPSKEAQEKLKAYQSELEGHTKKLNELKKATAVRKKAATMREAESEVAKAEGLAKAVGEAAGVFADDAKFLEMSSADIRAACEEALAAEKVANAALADARKFITARQIESKGKEMSTEVSQELIKYQTRLSGASADVAKYKKLCGSVEQRLAAKRVIEDATSKIVAAEEKVARVADEAEADPEQPDGEAAKKGGKEWEAHAAEATVALKTAGRFLDNQNRTQGLGKDEIEKMRGRLAEADKKLQATVAALKERTERVVVDGIVKESEERVKEAEDAVEKVTAAEEPFLKGVEDIPIEEASKLITALEQAGQAAHTATGGAKTFLAMKRLAAKRLSEGAAKAATEELTGLQTRLDAAAKKMSEVKRGMAERKMATVKREAESKVAAFEQKVAAAVEATQALVTGGELAPEAMKAACEKAGTTQHEASGSASETKTYLQGLQRDPKIISATDASVSQVITALLSRLTKAQVDLDKQKALLREQEHRFVANRLLKDASDMVEKLEALCQKAQEVAAPLTADDGGFGAGVCLGHAIAALRLHAANTSREVKALFEEIGEKESVSESKYVAFMSKLPELTNQKDTMLSEEQLQSSFKRMDSKGSGELNEEDFLEHFRTRFLINGTVSMTDTLAVKGSKTVRKLDVNEVVEQTEVPTKEPNLGMLRVKARAEKDGKEGYITMSGTGGTVYLVPYDPIVAVEKRVDQVLHELMDTGAKTQKYVDTKVDELKSVHKGPLAETKTALTEMGPRIRKVQQERKRLKSTISEAKKKQQDAMEAEKKRRQEAIDRQAADKILEEVNAAANEAEEQAGKAIAAATALVASKGADEENPLQAMDAAEKDLAAVSGTVDKALAKIKEQTEAVKSVTKGPFNEAKATLVKVKVKVGALDTKCKKQLAALGAARKQVATDAQEALRKVLRTFVVSKGTRPEELFKQLAGDGQSVPAKALRDFIEAIPEHGLKPAQFELGIDRLAAGLTKLTLLDMLQEFQQCVKDIAITTMYEVKDSKTVRKLLKGEVVEVLEHRETEGSGSTGLQRVRCRALQDGKEGWATLRGNQGTAFMERAPKPYYCCEEEVRLTLDFASSSEEARRIEPGEVLEVLEGPRQEDPLEFMRLKGKAGKDGKVGWVTMKGPQGTDVLERCKVLLCKQSIAITTTFDIAEGKAIRKLDVGEALEVIEGPKEDPVRSLTRVKARTKNDGKEGWVTLKGNQGTDYAEESDRHYVCRAAVALERRFASGSEALRTLDEGEVLEALDGPKAESKEGSKRVRGRNISDGSEGWFTLSDRNCSPWTPQYKCTQSTVINDALSIKDAKAVRKLEVGEVLEALETPVLEKGAGLLRIRVRAEKDGACGWATVRGNQGTVMLKPVLAGGGRGSAQ